jgi:NADPH:quinone reductase-like Zn-dependent oxidoreductase
MKAYEVGIQAGLDCLRRVDRVDPVAGPGDVIVRVIAAGLNYRDLMVMRCEYGAAKPETRIPLSDGVGVVDSVGEGVTIAPGTRVIAPHFVGWAEGKFSMAAFGQDLGVTRDGWLAEKIALPAAALIPVPDGVSDQSAATLAVAGGTVWHALVSFGKVQPGELVLTQGTGGVALFTLQLAKALGADVAITSSSDDKLARCKALGADYCINYQTHEDWPAALLAATLGRGADVVVDTLGSPALGQTLAAAAVEGRIAAIGALSGAAAESPGHQSQMIAKNLTIKGIASGNRAMLAAALDVVERCGIEMVVVHQFAFDEAHAAFVHLASGTHFGKVVIGR